MNRQEQGRCLRLFRERLGLSQAEAGRLLAKAGAFDVKDEDSARRSVIRQESGVEPRDRVLGAWSRVASKRGYRRFTGKQMKALLKDIRRVASLKEWTDLLEEVVPFESLPARLPAFPKPDELYEVVFDPEDVKAAREQGVSLRGRARVVLVEQPFEVLFQDESKTHFACRGPANYIIGHQQEPVGMFYVLPRQQQHLVLRNEYSLTAAREHPLASENDPLSAYQPNLEEAARAKKA